MLGSAMKILVVGAGIGGLALAALARQRGTTVTLIERAADFDHAGYMITLYPIGSRVLHGLGLHGEFVRRSAEFKFYDVHDGHGALLQRFDMGPLGERFGYFGQITRRDLLDLLRSAAPEVPLRWNVSVSSLEKRGQKMVAKLSDGSEDEWDAVIGADGIHSQTRRLVFGEEPDNETGWGLWLWWTNQAGLPRDTVSEYWGRGRFVGVYPTPDRIGAVAAAPKTLLNEHAINGDGARVRALFSEIGGGGAEVIKTFPDRTEDLFFWNLSDYRSREWTRGRFALLGDSACAFLPTAGVGASMALESAAVMADELSRTDAKFLPQAFTLYEKRRKARAEAAQNEARKLAAWLATESAAIAWTRDQFLKVSSIDTLAGHIAKSLAEPL